MSDFDIKQFRKELANKGSNQPYKVLNLMINKEQDYYDWR